MRRSVVAMGIAALLSLSMVDIAYAATSDTYTVRAGDSLWKIAQKYQVGLTEIIQANPQIKNPHLIYPSEKITVPLQTEAKSVESQVVQLINQERTKRGLPALKNNWELERVARMKSEDMRDRHYFSHTSPTYGDPFRMIRSFGLSYTSAAENIAAGQATPSAVITAWMNSAGHRQNILNPNFTQVGVGFARGGSYGYYWTAQFIHP